MREVKKCVLAIYDLTDLAGDPNNNCDTYQTKISELTAAAGLAECRKRTIRDVIRCSRMTVSK